MNEQIDHIQIERNAGKDVILGGYAVHDDVHVDDKEHAEQTSSEHRDEEVEFRRHEEDLNI